MLAHPSGSRLPARLALLVGILVAVAGCASAGAPAPNQVTAPRDTLGSGKEAAPNTATDVVPDGTQVIWTGSLQLQVADLRAAVDGAKTAIAGLGGYVSNSRESAGDNQPVAVITYRIPADKWNDGLAALRKLATKVVGEQTDSTDVTAQLVDIDARLKNLRASETALQEIASKATKVSDVLEVQARLTEVRGQIESLAAQQKALKDRVSYGTVTVTFGLQLGAVTEAAKRWDPAQEVDEASASLIALLQSVASAGIWFVIVWLPGLLVLALVAWIAVRAWRRFGSRFPRLPGRTEGLSGWSGSPSTWSGTQPNWPPSAPPTIPPGPPPSAPAGPTTEA